VKILVTGSNGFVGKNLLAELRNKGYQDILEFHRGSTPDLLYEYTQQCDFVFHLAGVNRPEDDSESEFVRGNIEFTACLLNMLKEHNNNVPVLMTSSVQAVRNNLYGLSKKTAEDLVFTYSSETGAKAIVYRLPNLFGKWSKPNYNSVVATFCHNIARGMGIEIHDPGARLTLCHIDDVLQEFLHALEGKENRDGQFCYVSPTYEITVGELADKIYSFHKNRSTLIMPSLENQFDKALYGTYLSYLKEDDFSYKLEKKVDARGWLIEFIKSESMGQIFISKTKPGITRGNHWHHTKVEKFLVIKGEAVIRFRKVGTDQVIEYRVHGETPEVVDIPAGYIHSIENTGQEDLITLFWACEIFNPEKPDTYWQEV
jgi:UDP-2-acetamido-2,6-beta-L-arabino-hexul-4-ose reductase